MDAATRKREGFTTPQVYMGVPGAPPAASLDTLKAGMCFPPEIAEALARGATILTGSPRAARALTRAHAEHARAQGFRSWPVPAIYDWSGWLAALYSQLHEEQPALLTPLQEEHLWQSVQAEDARAVVSPERLAQLAQGAYRLLSDYTAHSSRRAPWAASHEDAERFLAWAAGFDELCAQLGVLSQCRLAESLTRLADRVAVSPELILLGFDRLTPAQTALLEAFAATGTSVRHATPAAPAPERKLLAAADEAEELRACAVWARQQVERDPGRQVAILVPELHSVRPALDRVLRRTLQPEAACRPAGPALPYEFSLGAPLATIPLIASALCLLRWLDRPLPAAEFTALLLSGFLAATPEEALALAETDANLRKHGLLSVELSLPALLRHAEKQPELLPPGMMGRLRAILNLFQSFGKRNAPITHAEWTEAVPALLHTAGWPGFRETSSLAFQARERWDALLVELAALGLVSRPVPYARFVHELTEAAHCALFAAESRNAPVQVLGIAEAAGLTFDAVWLLGANEGRWPSAGRLHPLLAPGVQLDAGMPHSSPEADLALAEIQLRRVLTSTPEVVASYARQSAGAPARPSPLLRALQREPEPAHAPLVPDPCETRREPDEAVAPPWPAQRPAGGSETLKHQAACGFQAFAAKRLGAQPLDEEAWGLDAGERATLLHRALERLWSTVPVEAGSPQLHTQADLLHAVQTGSLDAKLRNAIQRAFTGATRETAGDRWRTAYLELEQQRLHTRLRRWLTEEAKRPPFAVAALEQRLENIQVGPLRLNLRVDRVDRLENGQQLLLDYKTADRVHPGLWTGERPDEPQLPIYAQFGGIEQLAGVAFAQIRPGKGKTKLHALVEDEAAGVEPKRNRTSFTAELRDEWTAALLALASRFADGDAPVNPKYGGQTCRLCGRHGICRVRSQAGAPEFGEEDEDA